MAYDVSGWQYGPGYGGGHQWNSTLDGWLDAQFVPALQPTVQHVRLVGPEVRWRHSWGRYRVEGERTDKGPWTFVVPVSAWG